jgi:hypothetical protein
MDMIIAQGELKSIEYHMTHDPINKATGQHNTPLGPIGQNKGLPTYMTNDWRQVFEQYAGKFFVKHSA